MSGKPISVKDVGRWISALGQQVAGGDPADLRMLTAVRNAVEKEMGVAVIGLRESGYTDVEIGEALGMTRQAVQQRWPRPAGGPVGAGARYVTR